MFKEFDLTNLENSKSKLEEILENSKKRLKRY